MRGDFVLPLELMFENSRSAEVAAAAVVVVVVEPVKQMDCCSCYCRGCETRPCAEWRSD